MSNTPTLRRARRCGCIDVMRELSLNGFTIAVTHDDDRPAGRALVSHCVECRTRYEVAPSRAAAALAALTA